MAALADHGGVWRGALFAAWRGWLSEARQAREVEELRGKMRANEDAARAYRRVREEVREARSRSELRKVFESNQHWLAMVELAPPEHSHTLLPDELSKMLFKGVEQGSEIVINNKAIQKSEFAEVRQSTFHIFFSLLYCCTYTCT